MFLRSLRRTAAVGLIAALAVAGTGVLAASAAVPGLLYVTAATGFDSTVYKSVRVFCPGGRQVIGAGYELVGAEGSVVLDDFIPSATSVLVGAGEIVGPGEPSDGTTDSWQVRATAVCADPVPGYTIVSGTSDFRTGQARRTRATCPAGTTPIGGGASLSNGFGQVSITDVQLAGNAVGVGAAPDADGYSGSWSVTAYAICGVALPGLQVLLSFSSSDSSIFKAQTAFCPAGTQVIGGGWQVFQDVGIPQEVLNIHLTLNSGTDPGATAFASEDADGDSSSWSMFAQVVCATP